MIVPALAGAHIFRRLWAAGQAPAAFFMKRANPMKFSMDGGRVRLTRANAAIALDHFKRLSALLEKERAVERAALRAADSQSLADRERQGIALSGLYLEEQFYGIGEQILLSLRRENGQSLPRVSFETGDVLSLSPMRGDGQLTAAVSVAEIEEDRLTVAVHGRLGDWINSEGRYQLNQSENERSYTVCQRVLARVADDAGNGLGRLRDLFAAKRSPRVEAVSIQDISWCDASLNPSQQLAVSRCLGALDLAIVHGPPGTGKTRVLVELIRQLLNRRQSVLVTAPSNTACDHILSQLVGAGVAALRVGHPTRIHPNLRRYTLSALLKSHPLAVELAAARRELEALFRKQDRERERNRYTREQMRELRENIASGKQACQALREELKERVLGKTEVFVGTLLGIEGEELGGRRFDVVIMDEAAQALEPLAWVALSRADKVIMAGDHCQLPPLVRSSESAQAGLGITLFERAHALFVEPVVTLLDRQYRMHATIMGFACEQFYEGRLTADGAVAGHVLADLAKVNSAAETQAPFLFLDTTGQGFEERQEAGSGSYENPEEAALVWVEVQRLLDAGVAPESIAVVSPYSAQVRALLAKRPHPAIEIDTVDGFQGREKEAVIVTLVRSNTKGELGFLTDTRRMNVAMTRARRRLLVIGDSGTVATIAFYAALVEYAERHQSYRTVWEQVT